MQWVDIELTLAIHERQLAEHGGLNGIRDKNGLEAALARPQNLYAYGEHDIFVLAAALGYGLIRNHPFADGNKRTAYVCTRLFLKLHNQDVQAPLIDRVHFFEQLAAGNIKEADFATWLKIGVGWLRRIVD